MEFFVFVFSGIVSIFILIPLLISTHKPTTIAVLSAMTVAGIVLSVFSLGCISIILVAATGLFLAIKPPRWLKGGGDASGTGATSGYSASDSNDGNGRDSASSFSGGGGEFGGGGASGSYDSDGGSDSSDGGDSSD